MKRERSEFIYSRTIFWKQDPVQSFGERMRDRIWGGFCVCVCVFGGGGLWTTNLLQNWMLVKTKKKHILKKIVFFTTKHKINRGPSFICCVNCTALIEAHHLANLHPDHVRFCNIEYPLSPCRPCAKEGKELANQLMLIIEAVYQKFRAISSSSSS